MLIQLSHISKSYSGQTILKDVTFSIQDGERIGLLGKNGSGKSTLFKIIAGIEKQDDGVLSIQPKDMSIGYVPQAPNFNQGRMVKDFLSEGLDLWEEYKVDLALHKLAMGELKTKRLGHLSSGQKTRVYLARLIMQEPDVLLLDEPTNHLDVNALKWLENYVKSYNGAVFVISHDRRFLDNTVEEIVEIEHGEIKKYGGNYSFYKQQKRIELEANQRAYDSQQKEIKRLELEAKKQKERAERLDKDRKPTKDNDSYAPTYFANRASKKISSASKTIEKRLDNLDRIQKPKKDPQLAAIFKPSIESSKTVVSLSEVVKKIGKLSILDDTTLILSRGDRVALMGENGSGKSTLIKIILGEVQADSGIVNLGNDVVIGYLSQEHKELDSENSVIDELVSSTKLDKTDAYKLLVRFLLPVSKINQSVNSLSSGEKAKLLLAQIMASGANFIILDEPTNHLDIPSREVLEDALSNYEGTLLVVSHDRYFIDRIGINKSINL